VKDWERRPEKEGVLQRKYARVVRFIAIIYTETTCLLTLFLITRLVPICSTRSTKSACWATLNLDATTVILISPFSVIIYVCTSVSTIVHSFIIVAAISPTRSFSQHLCGATLNICAELSITFDPQ
jgi:Sec-independent protein secretion pathway component TatC